MNDNRFSGAPSSSSRGGGPDQFGYFTAPAEQATSQFGGPPAPPVGPPVATAPPVPLGTPFGPPPAGPLAPVTFGSPYAQPVAPPASRRGFRVKPAVLVVLLLVVLGGAFQGYRVWKHNQPITMPTTLAGLPRATDARVTAATADLGTTLQQANPDLRTQTASYANAGDLTTVLMVAVGRGHANITKDFSEANGQFGSPSEVGSSSCALSVDKTMTVCERTSGDLTAIVLSIGAKGPQTPQQVSAAVDELWPSL